MITRTIDVTPRHDADKCWVNTKLVLSADGCKIVQEGCGKVSLSRQHAENILVVLDLWLGDND